MNLVYINNGKKCEICRKNLADFIFIKNYYCKICFKKLPIDKISSLLSSNLTTKKPSSYSSSRVWLNFGFRLTSF